MTDRLGSVTNFINKLENDKKSQIKENDRLIHRIQQLELDLKNQLQIGSEIANQNTEYCKDILTNRSEDDTV